MRGIKKEFIKYVFLNIVGMIGLSCYILADTYFVSKGIGPNGLAALNIAIPVYSIINGLGLMLGMGGATRFSMEMGQKQKEKAQGIFSHTVNVVLILGIILVIAGLFLPGVFAKMLGADQEIFSMTKTYIRVILLFSPAFLFNNVLNCFVRNDRNPKLAMAAMLTGCFGNIVLDYILIFPCGLGMLGAVLATGLAPVIGIFLLSFHFIKRENSFSYKKQQLDLGTVWGCVQLGLSSFITEVSSGIVILVFNVLILGLTGNTGVAAYGVIANVALVVISVFTGVAQGMQPIVSERFGRGKKDMARSVYKYGIFTAIIIGIVLYAVSFIGADVIVAIFNEEQNKVLQELATDGFRLYSSGFLFAGMNVVTAAYFSAVGKAKPSFLVSILRGMVLIVPLAFILAKAAGMTGIWLAFPITEAITCLVGFTIFCLTR